MDVMILYQILVLFIFFYSLVNLFLAAKISRVFFFGKFISKNEPKYKGAIICFIGWVAYTVWSMLFEF